MTRKLVSGVVALAAILGLSWAESYELKTEKDSYAKGEVVRLRFTNNSTQVVKLAPTFPPVYNIGGTLVHSWLTTYASSTVEVAPGKSYPESGWWEWNQKDQNSGQQVSFGKYEALLKIFSLGNVNGSYVKRWISVVESTVAPMPPPIILPPPLGAVTLTTDRSSYKTGSGGGAVLITVTNNFSQTVYLPGLAHWHVEQVGKTIFLGPTSTVMTPIAPEKSIVYSWNKKGMDGKPVKAGSYTIKLGPIFFASGADALSRTVALTPTGAVAGKSLFPLFVGNEWVYVSTKTAFDATVGSSTIQVTNMPLGPTLWYQVENLLDANRWVRMNGKTLCTSAQPGGSASDLFRFNRKKGYQYQSTVSPFGKVVFKVVGTDETVVTPAGTFTGCTQIVMAQLNVVDVYSASFWFAPGIGLVQCTQGKVLDTTLYQLKRAKIKGVDSVWYTIGME